VSANSEDINFITLREGYADLTSDAHILWIRGVNHHTKAAALPDAPAHSVLTL
jgi:hypothetical protein